MNVLSNWNSFVYFQGIPAPDSDRKLLQVVKLAYIFAHTLFLLLLFLCGYNNNLRIIIFIIIILFILIFL